MPLKIERHSDKKKAKFFTGGKPKDFHLVTKNNATIAGRLNYDSKAYVITTGCSSSGHAFDAAALREVAEHLAELADILEDKVA